MNRTKLIIVATFAFLLAGATAFGAYKILRQAMSMQGEQVNVVMAVRDLPVGTLLQAKDLKQGRISRQALPVGAFVDLKAVIERGLVVPVSANELILETKLAPREAGAGLPTMIPEGMRAVSVKVNEVVSVAGFVLPGTRVDVLLTGNPTSQRDLEDVTTTTVLENVKVLAAGTQLQQNAKGEPQKVPVITLLVTPEDAQKLTLAASEGKIQLSLRNPLDSSPSSPAALRNGVLYGAKPKQSLPQPKRAVKAKVQAPLPPPEMTYVVEVIHGGKRDVTKF